MATPKRRSASPDPIPVARKGSKTSGQIKATDTTKASSGRVMLVRLKPFNARRNHIMRKYTHVPSGLKFEEHRGWYRVDADVALELEAVRQRETDQDSPAAFDIATEEQANAIEKREKAEADTRASAGAPNRPDLTTSDLRTRGQRDADARRPPREARSMS